jgi:hypothetical protein
VGAGNFDLPVLLTNSSATSCLLDGYPTLEGMSASGAVSALAAQHGTYFNDPGPVADIAPGRTASVLIAGGSACDAAQGGNAQPSFASLRLGLPNGDTVNVASGFSTACGISVSRFGVPADLPAAPDFGPSPLKVMIRAPATARVGRPLSFAVDLLNPSGHAVRLSPCPPFSESLTTRAKQTKRSVAGVTRAYFLNCAGHPEIGASSSQRFEMRLNLPKRLSLGAAQLGWAIEGSFGPAEFVSVQIVP